MSIFTGSGTAIITPMNADGSVNYESFKNLIEFQIANETDAIIVCGTTGEASTLTHEEHLDVIKYCVEVVNKRIPVIAGTGSNCTETAIYLSTEAEKAGADGLLVVSPYYNKATQNGLFAHFKAVADSVKIPVLLYNVQSRTGVNIAPATVVRLCEACENIVGVKEASGNISQVAKIAALGKGKIDIYSGNDDQIIPILYCLRNTDNGTRTPMEIIKEIRNEFGKVFITRDFVYQVLNKKFLPEITDHWFSLSEVKSV